MKTTQQQQSVRPEGKINSATTKWAGVYPAVTTKFDDNGQVNLEEMQNHLDWQILSGVDGIIVTGSLGENQVLSSKEKQNIIRNAVTTSSGRVPVLATAAETTTRAVCDFVEEGSKNGADGFMVLPPMVYPCDKRETIDYFRAVARASDKPIMIYNNPVSYKVDVTPEMFDQLADEETFVAIKESSGILSRITDIINYTGDRYQVFTGVDTLALESLLLGAVGWVAGLVCAFPAETVQLYRLAMAGNIEDARKIYRWFMPLLHLDVSTKLVQNIKLVEALVSGGSEIVRPPRLPLAGKEREIVEEIVSQALASRPEVR